jgi:uncharacterized protein (TIGR03086 family)
VDDQLQLYRQVSEWTGGLAAGAENQLDAPTPCDSWNVRTLLNHMIDTQRYFAGTARGEKVSMSQDPASLGIDDPPRKLAQAQKDVIDAFSQPGIIDERGFALGIAFSDQLLHGWDLARATHQDATMPDGLAARAYDIVYGRFTDEQREGVFKPEIAMPNDASAQDRLLAYTGRAPAR